MSFRTAGKKEKIISLISFIYFVVVLFYIFMDGIGKKGSSGVSGFIEQDNLRKSLGDWYQLVFYTFQVNLYFLIVGILYVFFYDKQVMKNLFFCSASLLLLCLFAMFVFKFSSFKRNAYEASKTLFVHCIIPISGLIMVFLIRKEIVLQWKWLWINSLYVLFWMILSVIIYYTFKFSPDSQHPSEPLWIYGFLDYDNQIMFVHFPGNWKYLGIILALLISPIVGILVFLFIKFIFNIKIKKIYFFDFYLRRYK